MQSKQPSPKELNCVVRLDGVVTNSYSLGLQLLDNCNTLRSNNQNDVEGCCNELFKKWLEAKSDAS